MTFTMSSSIRHVDDVDLFAGAIAEKHVSGGIVGETFACILGRQFRNTKVGDRFWHERKSKVTGFTKSMTCIAELRINLLRVAEQLDEIRKVTLAKIICNNSDNVKRIQPFVLLQPLKQAVKGLT